MNTTDKIFVAGHLGMVGSSIVRLLKKLGYNNILISPKSELNLTNQQAVNNWFEVNKPDYVFLAAAKVGGIGANKTYPAEFLHENISIQTNVIHASYINKVKKLLFLGSSCIYPKENPLPIKENRILSGPLEPTNEAYSLSKIVGLKMCEYSTWCFNYLEKEVQRVLSDPYLSNIEEALEGCQCHIGHSLCSLRH